MKFLSYLGNVIRWPQWGAMSDTEGLQQIAPMQPLLRETEPITVDRGLQLSAVWSCVSLLSETIASLPLAVYEVAADGSKKEARGTRLWLVLHQPNELMTAHDFWLAMSMNRFLHGNAYALIIRDGAGELVSLVPLSAEQMTVALIDNDLIYQYARNGEYTYFRKDQILHWKGVGNGTVGLSVFDYMRTSVTELKNAQKNATVLYGNGNQLTGILTTDRYLNNTQLKELRSRFETLGAFNGDSWLHFMPPDMKFQQVSMSAADAQLLQSRQFGVEEIGRWFGVPSSLLNSGGGADAGSVESSVESFYRSTIQPQCIALEQAITQRVFTAEEKEKYAPEFKMNALLRANVSSRYSSYAQALQNGFMTRNEVRKMENLPPVDGADELTAQSNLFPVSELGSQSTKQPQTPLGEPIKQ